MKYLRGQAQPLHFTSCQPSFVGQLAPSPVDSPVSDTIDWATSAISGTTLKRVSEAPVIMGQRPTCPLGLNAFPLCLVAFMAILASPPSSPSAYVYAVLGAPSPTGTTLSIWCILKRRTFILNCDYGSKVMKVNGTVFAAPF